MRNKIIKILIITLISSMFIVGCSASKSNVDVSENPIEGEVIEDSDTNNSIDTLDDWDVLDSDLVKNSEGVIKRSNDSMYKFYASKLEAVKDLVDGYAFDYKEIKGDENTKYSDIVSILYDNSQDNGIYNSISYNITSNNLGDVEAIELNITMELTPMVFSNSGMTYDDTMFKWAHEIFNPGTEVAEVYAEAMFETYDYFIEPSSVHFDLNAEENLELNEDSMVYTIRITPDVPNN